MITFPCATCDRVLERSTFSQTTWCPTCGAGHRVLSTTVKGQEGTAVMRLPLPGAVAKRPTRCPACAEPYTADGYPALALFRTAGCTPDHWHVIEVVSVGCDVCGVDLVVHPDDSLTLKWADLRARELEAD